MAFCHGSGNPATDGCCRVNGAVCPLRWKLVDGRVFDHTGADLGTVDAMIRTLVGNSAPRRQRVADQIQGVTFVCLAAVRAIDADPSRLNNRAAFEAAWVADAQYQSTVRPHWAAIERALGLADGSYNCPTWAGVGAFECCYAEAPAENQSKAAALTTSAVTVRQGGARS